MGRSFLLSLHRRWPLHRVPLSFRDLSIRYSLPDNCITSRFSPTLMRETIAPSIQKILTTPV
jgi:hypothetical protein